MTSISIEALKGKTIKEIRELIRQAESLPENQSPVGKGEECMPTHASPPLDAKNQTAQEIINEIKGGDEQDESKI